MMTDAAADVEGLIQNLEEEAKTNKYMVAEVHPKEIAAMKKVIKNIQKIVMEPAMGQSDLDDIHQEVGISWSTVKTSHTNHSDNIVDMFSIGVVQSSHGCHWRVKGAALFPQESVHV